MPFVQALLFLTVFTAVDLFLLSPALTRRALAGRHPAVDPRGVTLPARTDDDAERFDWGRTALVVLGARFGTVRLRLIDTTDGCTADLTITANHLRPLLGARAARTLDSHRAPA